MSKEQFMVIFDEGMMVRFDALRIVTGVSRAEVVRRAVSEAYGPIDRMEYSARERLDRLKAIASELNMPWETWVREVVAGRKTVPSLETYEALHAEKMGRQRLAPAADIGG